MRESRISVKNKLGDGMKILLIGSGGREHALAWKIAQSQLCSQLICAPGNAGICEIADCVDIAPDNIEAILQFVQDEAVEFVIIGPEVPLDLGLVDKLAERGIPAFGPKKLAAKLESSKAFTKAFCDRHNIPTAKYGVFWEIDKAVGFLDKLPPPYVIKADGLAAGKGVVIVNDKKQAKKEVGEFFSGRFGKASSCVVIEEFLCGHEVSFFAISDGKTAMPLIEAQDHKRAFDGDKGPNTGGMGAYSPVPGFDAELRARVMSEIIKPTIKGMKAEKTPFVGILFAGLMITEDGPKLIEYNVRFGDPEAQVLMRRLKSDLLELMILASNGELENAAVPIWSDNSVVNIVMAAKGYPDKYKKGEVITGIEAANQMDGVKVFHAGTKINEKAQITSAGGRVLNITAEAKTIDEALSLAYKTIDEVIDWPDGQGGCGGFVRRDIAKMAIEQKT